MLITDIRPAKKSLVDLYIDGEFAVQIDKNVMAESKFKEYAEISEEELEELVLTSQKHRAKQKALFLLSRRDYSEKELIDKLAVECSRDIAVFTTERLKELSLISDERYARKYAKDLLLRKHFAKRRAEYEMLKKGLSKDLIQEVLEDIEIDPVEELVLLLKSKFLAFLNDEKGRRRTVNNLIRKGYNYEDIKIAMQSLNCDDEE